MLFYTIKRKVQPKNYLGLYTSANTAKSASTPVKNLPYCLCLIDTCRPEQGVRGPILQKKKEDYKHDNDKRLSMSKKSLSLSLSTITHVKELDFTATPSLSPLKKS